MPVLACPGIVLRRAYECHYPHEVLGFQASSVILALVFSDTWFAEQNTWVPIPVQRQAFVCKGDVHISDVVYSVLEQFGMG